MTEPEEDRPAVGAEHFPTALSSLFLKFVEIRHFLRKKEKKTKFHSPTVFHKTFPQAVEKCAKTGALPRLFPAKEVEFSDFSAFLWRSLWILWKTFFAERHVENSLFVEKPNRS